MSTLGKKDPKGRLAKTPRVLRARAVGNTYGVAFGTHIYAAACGAPPLAEFLCTKREALPFYRKQGGKSEDLYDIADEGCALFGETLVADLEKGGWIRVVGGLNERWLPLQGSGLERIEHPSKVASTVKVPAGWEILTWQACQGAVLKMVIAGFDWGADAAVVQDTVQQRLLRIGTKRNDRPGSILGDGAGITITEDGTINAGSDVVIIARPMIGVSWGEDVFDVAGLLNDASYAAAAAAAFSVRPALRELEADAIEAGQQTLATEVRGWFAPSPPSNAELVRVTTREAASLRRLWAHELRERRLLRAHEGFVQIPEFASDVDEADIAEQGAAAAMMAAAVAAEEEFDPVQIWVQVALGSILELAVCIPPQLGQAENIAFERLITRGTRTFAGAAPLSLFGAGRTSSLCVDETVSALGSLVESMPQLKPAGLEMLLALATVTGSARLIAQALQWLLAGADGACAKRCVANLSSLWQLGSVMHFETLKVLDKNAKRLERKKDPPSWRFTHLAKCGGPASVMQRLRSHRTVSFEEPLPAGVYWEITVHSADSKNIIVGIWLESKKKPVGCCLGDGSAVGAGSEAVPVEDAPEPKAGSVFGFVATAEDLTVSCDGRPFSRIMYKKLLVAGERVAVCVEQGAGTQIDINVGQDPLAYPPSSSTGIGNSDSSSCPVIWGRACDPYSKSPYQPFLTEPESADEVVDLLLQITERNIGRLGSSVDSGTPVQHTFAKTDQMNATEDGTVVSNVRENSWARVDCEITVGVSVEFCFEVLDDRENDEGTCYGISTAECTKYDSRGSFVLRGYSGHLYCDGSDKGEKFVKIHPRSRVGFRFDYSEGKLEAWLDDQEPRLLLSDPNQFAGRTFYPTVFNYHGTRTKVKLLSCNSGLRSRAMLQDSFVLEVSAPAAALWIHILEQLLVPVRKAVAQGLPHDSPVVEQASGPIATVLKVLLAAANVSPNIWVEFGAVREELMQTIDFIVIEQRNNPALRQPRDIGILLISVLGVGALFGGPDQVLKVFLSVRDSEASRLGQTLVAYLLKTRRSTQISNSLILELSKLAVSDELSCQILLRLALNAFIGGAEQLASIAAGALDLAERALADNPEVALGSNPPSFISELMPVLIQLMAALPRRDSPEALPRLLDLLKPAAKALTAIRKAVQNVKPKDFPRFITDSIQGLHAFMCGVAGRLMATGDAKPFPLDIGDAELRDSAADMPLPSLLIDAEALINEIAGSAALAQADVAPLPEIISEILSGTGRGEALVQELSQKSQSKIPVSPVQRAAFAAIVLCKGPDAWEAVASEVASSAAKAAWQATQIFANNKVRPMKQSIAASEGDAVAFEAGIASRLSWLVRSVAWPSEAAPPPNIIVGRAVTAPENSSRANARTKLSMMERMRHLGRMNAVEGHGLPEWHVSLMRAQAQLVDEASSFDGTCVDALIGAACAQRDVAVGRRCGLRLLRYLVHGTVDAEGIEPLLPSLHAALEDTLAKPLAGLAHGGVSRRRAVLIELSGLLRDIFERCSAKPISPTVGSLGLAMMCVPLPREELEVLLGHLLNKDLPALALSSRNGAVQYCRAHAAQLVLRTYIAGRGRGGPELTALLAQITANLESLATRIEGAPVPSDSCMDPLEVDWDFGTFGRLSARRLDSKVLAEALSKTDLANAQATLVASAPVPIRPATSNPNITAESSPGGGSTVVLTTEGGSHETPVSVDSTEGEEKSPAISITLKDLRQHRTSGVLSPSVAANLLLRFPQAAYGDALVDPVELVQALTVDKGEELPWQDDGKPGACAAALTLLRPAAELLAAGVPRVVERVLAVALSGSRQRLPACLAVCLYMKLQLSDDQVTKDAPMLLEKLGTTEHLAMSTNISEGRSGTLVFATMLARQLTSRAGAMADAVLNAIGDVYDMPPTTSALAALNLVGGPMRCAACQMQLLNTSFGRSIVVAANSQNVAVLSLDGATDAKAVQWLRWGDLQAPVQEVSMAHGVGRTCMWGEVVVECLLSAVQQLLAKGSGREQRLAPQLLRALTAVLPTTPHWDVAIVTEVVRELEELAAAGVGDVADSSIDLLEHHCTLLRLALHRDANSSSPASDTEKDVDSTIQEPDALTDCQGDCTLQAREPVSLMGALNQAAEWRGKYKLKRHTNTWAKSKWHMELRLSFRPGGGLDVVARWPKFLHPSTGQNARWHIEEGSGISVEFDLELPGGRREGGRTRDCEVFTWKGRLVQSRSCPHLEGDASGRVSDLKYEWYAVPPDPLAILRAAELDLFAKQDESLPRPFSVLSFNTGFMEQKAEHFSNTLGISNLAKSDGSARDLAVAAVSQLEKYQYISGPREVAKVAKQSSEENWGMHDSLEEECDISGGAGIDERWCSVEEVFGESSCMRSANEIMVYLRREEKQLRHALLMRLLQVMLANRPANTAIADSFPEATAREAFFKRALRLPDAGAVLQRCTEDFAASGEVARSALTVAVEGLLTPFMAGGISTLTVESDHDYHPNEDWVFRLSIPGASRMKLKFDSRCKMENSRDFLQFYAERDSSGELSKRLHSEEKLCGQYPTGFPDLFLPGDSVWMKFQSDGSQEFWGFRFTLSAEGGGGGAAAVPFPAALKLLVAITKALSGEERRGVQLMGSSVLLSVAATQPLSDEATRAAEAMCELLPEPCQWSDFSWCAALSLMSVAERNGRRQLLASLVTLLSGQMGPRPFMSNELPMPLFIDYVTPRGTGALLHGRMTLVTSTTERVHALGSPVPLLSRAGRALFCVRVEPTSVDNACLAIGISVGSVDGENDKEDSIRNAVFCNVSKFASPGAELSVEMRRQGSNCDVLQLVVSGQTGSSHCDLPLSTVLCDAQFVLPVLRVEGFGAIVTLQSSPNVSIDSETAAARLCQLRRTSRLVEACRGGRDGSLPASLVVGAWVRREGGDEPNVSAVQERLRSKCVVSAESEHNHSWGLTVQKLEIPDAPALELAFPRMDIAEGYRLRITHDAAGELPVMRLCKPADDGAIKHSIECGKYLFATLDSADPDLREKAQQEDWMRVPAGWELAPHQGEILQEVIAKHRWATETIIVGNGDAFYTLNHEEGGKAGQLMGKEKLSKRTIESITEYRPNGACGRILVRRLRPGLAGGNTATVLKPEDVASGETVVVPGSTIFIHGPVPQPRRWDPVPGSEGNGGGVDTAAHGDLEGEPAPAESVTNAPLQVCAGPWTWAMSPTHNVRVILTPDGNVRLDKTNLEMMTAEEVEIVRDVMTNVGDAAVQPDASWVEPDKFRLASLSGTWKMDSRELASVKIKLEGADDLGSAELLFSASGLVSRDDDLLQVMGDVTHTRWGTHKVSFEGRTTLPGRLSSAWKWPSSREPVIEVQLRGCIDPPSALCVDLLTGSRLGCNAPLQQCENSKAMVRQCLVLGEGEYVEKVYGNSNICMGRVWMEVVTNRHQKISWPTQDEQADCLPRSFEHTASEFCEITACSVGASAGTDSFSIRPSALTQSPPFEMQRLPDGLWEGFFEFGSQKRQDVQWQLTSGSRQGSFEAVLSGHSVQSGGSGDAHGTFSNTGHVQVQLMGQTLEGRCAIDALRRLCMVLVSNPGSSSAVGMRLMVCSKSSPSTWECCLPPIIDGPSLVYRAYAKAPSKHLLHTARDAWTQQVASDFQVAEVMIRHLGHSLGNGCAGFAVGIANSSGSLGTLGTWPSDVSGRWLWRSDGAMAHATAGEHQSKLWSYGVGDIVGFAVSPDYVSFLKNGDRVRTVPRHVRGDTEPLGRGGTPVFVVGLGCNAAIELRKGVQYPHLCESFEDCFASVFRSPSGSGATETCKVVGKVKLKSIALAVLAACKVIRKTLNGPVVLAQRAKEVQGAVLSNTVGADVWVQTGFESVEGCLTRNQRLVEEFGGESVVKGAIVKYHRSQSKQVESISTIQETDVSDLHVNELSPLDGSPVTEGRVSARFKKGAVEKFFQVRLERSDDTWKVVEIFGDRSGRTAPCEGVRHILPATEVVAVNEDEGWIKVHGLGSPSRPFWYPVETKKDGRVFARKQDYAVSEVPCFSRPALVNHSWKPATMDSDVPVEGLPVGLDQYTVEAFIRVPKEESGKEMCIIAWAAEGYQDQGLSLFDGFAHASCGLKGAKKVCDGTWHHIACTFDGRVHRLWTDFEQSGEIAVSSSKGVVSMGKDIVKMGAYTPGLKELRNTVGTFRGDMKQVRIWKVALTPAALKTYASCSEKEVHEEVCMEAADTIFNEMDVRGAGAIRAEDMKPVLGCDCPLLLSCLTSRAGSSLARDEWLFFCRQLKASQGDSALKRFLQACARNLGHSGRPVKRQSAWAHPVEVPIELALFSNSFGWRVEAKPTSLTDAMLEHIKDEGLEQFRRQACIMHTLLGRSADEAVVELADRVALQQGTHDDCWTKMLAVADWSRWMEQPRWMEQAVSHARLDDFTAHAKLQQVLAWALASGKPLAEALEQPFKSRADDPKVEELRLSAEQAGGTAEACAALASELLNQDGGSQAAQTAADTMFQDVVGNMLFFRFLILLELNWDVGRDFLPLIDLAAPADSAYGRLLAQVKPRLLGHLKFSQFQRVLASTKYEGSTPIIILNRKLAVTLREKGRVDWEFRKSLIGQFMTEFRKQSIGPKLFRRPWQSRCTKVQFKGEGGEDAGGLYREALDAVAQELHSRAVPLFVPCPNAVAEIGDNRDAWCMNPRATAPECIRALEFVGQLLGLALRTGDLLPLIFAPFTWKGIVGDERTRDDVRSIDVFAEKHLAILGGDQSPSEETLAAMGGLQFAYPDVTGEEIELVEGGREISVTAENASEFAQLLLRNRLMFDRIQLQAVRRGLATVVPIQLIRLWSWRDMQERICGVPEVDIENVKRHTTYKNCAATSEHVRFMWEALEQFTQKQRRSFLRFVWGRSSLPTVERWERNFTVQLLSGTDDSRLPCSHTCFFTLDLPMYSTAEVCFAKLLYCITHCLAIDADGAAARSLNWDEDDED